MTLEECTYWLTLASCPIKLECPDRPSEIEEDGYYRLGGEDPSVAWNVATRNKAAIQQLEKAFRQHAHNYLKLRFKLRFRDIYARRCLVIARLCREALTAISLEEARGFEVIVRDIVIIRHGTF